MNMAGRPDLAMGRITINFPDEEQSIFRPPSRYQVFGYKVETADGVLLACGDVTRDRQVHELLQGYDQPREVPAEIDLDGIFHPVIHQRLAKQCVAMALFDYDPENPGEMTEAEERALIDAVRGEGTYSAIKRAVASLRPDLL